MSIRLLLRASRGVEHSGLKKCCLLVPSVTASRATGNSAPVPQPDPLEHAAELAIKEMVSRLETRPGELPDHVLGKFVNDLHKFLERREHEEEESKPFSLLDEVDTLPPERARGLLREEIRRLEMELEKHQEALSGLGGGE